MSALRTFCIEPPGPPWKNTFGTQRLPLSISYDELTRRTRDMKFRKLSNSLGAEVLGFKIQGDLAPAVVDELREAFHRYQILLFRDQPISFETHIAFSRYFGPLDQHEHVPDYRHPDHPTLIKVTNEGKERSKVFGQQWHSDHSMAIRPSLASLLHAHEIPDVGGDTMFTNMCGAYDSLSSGMQRMLSEMRAVHTVIAARHLRGLDEKTLAKKESVNPPVIHPVVRAHPETGRKALYVSEMLTSHFEGMSVEESRPLLEYLFAHSVRPELVYRHQWRRHDLLMWDNRCTMHLALMDYDHQQLRRLFRTTIEGDYVGEYAHEHANAA
ncbi:TauD/TfdA family dioxygenase [Bordetella sp. BOR01]|uniref:TauD/TfdA dioxygenase family protein n=1 Tax=Bordetella sp. BOR01 TaxID=2854779 RepID=UPI001C46DE60|nr:TauD/TfdA family dioxygenase [Bordetella sp. BOR01]MBV7486053.1 TauD/TfdA family dioxygenase [Bordetella sp. BOR01]